jgi:hypothetical protein
MKIQIPNGWRTLVLLLPAVAARMLAGNEPDRLPSTAPLQGEGDFAAVMNAGLHRYLIRETAASVEARAGRWARDLSSPEQYAKSVAPNREHLRRIIGQIDPRVPPAMHLEGTVEHGALVGRGRGYAIFAVRWPVFNEVHGEGLLLQPEAPPRANIVAIPDCAWTPEMLTGLAPGVPESAQFARRLVESGARVLVPLLIDRSHTHSGHPNVGKTNIPHREYIYRAAFEMGRHLIGYEVQKVLAAVDWFKTTAEAAAPVGLVGYGEGGLIALHTAAVDERIAATVVSGYVRERADLWQEPIDRNVWGLLREFGDAELITLVAPRGIIVEASEGPRFEVPPRGPNQAFAAPAVLVSPPVDEAEREVLRARKLLGPLARQVSIEFVPNPETNMPGSERALGQLLRMLDARLALAASGPPPERTHAGFDGAERLRRQVSQLVEYNQGLMRDSEFTRRAYWSKADRKNVDGWQRTTGWYRDQLWQEVIGPLPPLTLPPNVRSRQIYDQPAYRGYEVVLDVFPDVIAHGILLVPKNIPPGERRPVVVCQHGRNGRPRDVADPAINNRAYRTTARIGSSPASSPSADS